MHAFLLVFVAGALAAGLHALGGLMLTPFFGASPFFWANVIVSLPLSLSLGLLLGRPGARGAERLPSLPFRIGVGAGILTIAVPIALAPLARAILDRNPDSLLAPIATVLLLLTLPAAAAVGALPAAMALAGGAEPGKGGKGGKPRAGAAARAIGAIVSGGPLLIFSLGAVAGVAAASPTLLDPQRFPPWAAILGLGGVLVVVGASGTGQAARGLALLVAAALAAAFFAAPNEVRTYGYTKALIQGFDLRVGRYYLDTAGRRTLDETDVQRRYEDLRQKIRYAPDKSVAAVLVVETLRGLGAAQLTGPGLLKVLDLYLPDHLKPRIMPLFQAIEAVRSDGKGTVAFALKREAEDDPVEVVVPNEEGQLVTFVFTGDFTLTLLVQPGAEESRTTIDIGPVEVEKAGFFDAHDTHRTPVIVKDAKLFFDAYLLGFTVISRKDRVVLRVRGQGSIGPVQETVLDVIDLAEPPPR